MVDERRSEELSVFVYLALAKACGLGYLSAVPSWGVSDISITVSDSFPSLQNNAIKFHSVSD